MAMHRCPGMSATNWRPKDVDEVKCQCGKILEFWKDDVKVACPGCGKVTFNPKLGSLCLSWCAKAAECIGSLDIEEWKKQIQGKDSSPDQCVK